MFWGKIRFNVIDGSFIVNKKRQYHNYVGSLLKFANPYKDFVIIIGLSI